MLEQIEKNGNEMIVRKFMRLLLVPGMAVPLVLVACSSGDSDTMEPDPGTMEPDPGTMEPDPGTMEPDPDDDDLSLEGLDVQIKTAAEQPYNGSERSELSFDGSNFGITIGGGETKTVTMVEATGPTGHMADEREFKGYDIKASVMEGSQKTGTLDAVVLTRSEPANPSDPKDESKNHLAFGFWIVKGEGENMNSVGTFGAHGFDRTSVEDVIPGGGQDMEAEFSGPSFGVATKGDSNIAFEAMVSLTAKWLMKRSGYLLGGHVRDFNFDGDGIEMGDIRLKNTEIEGKEIARGDTRLVSDVPDKADMDRGDWQAGFASANSIVGSYGISSDDTHLIGSFGAYKDPPDDDEM